MSECRHFCVVIKALDTFPMDRNEMGDFCGWYHDLRMFSARIKGSRSTNSFCQRAFLSFASVGCRIPRAPQNRYWREGKVACPGSASGPGNWGSKRRDHAPKQKRWPHLPTTPASVRTRCGTGLNLLSDSLFICKSMILKKVALEIHHLE